MVAGSQRRRPSRGALLRPVATAISLVATAGVLTRAAGRGDLVADLGAVAVHERLLLLAAAALNLLTYWIVLAVALPGLGVRRAAAIHLPSTALANCLPAGGALGTGISFTILRSYGYGAEETAAAAVTISVWNTLLKAAAAMAAFAVLAAHDAVDQHTRAVVAAALVTTVAVVVGVVLVLVPTRRASRAADRLQTLIRRTPARRGRPWSAVLDNLRAEVRRSVRRNGPRLTVATVGSHAALSAVFLVAVRAVGIGPSVAPAPVVLSLFALSRAACLVPSTPGGIGVVELTLTALLSSSGAAGSRVVAAVLVYRAATYLLPTILGGLALAGWATVGGATLLHPTGSSTPSPAEPDDVDVPLVVDLDGTFFPVTTRTLMAGRLLLTHPTAWCRYRRLRRTDRTASKHYLCEHVGLDVRRAPVRGSLLSWLEAERARGRRVFIASGAPQPIVDAVVATYAPLFAHGWGSSTGASLVGPAKAALLCQRFGTGGFDYVGDATEDIAVWDRARRAVLCCPTRPVARQARQRSTVGRVFCRLPGRSLGLGVRTAWAAARQRPMAPQPRLG
jgi:putative heme transporter